jgi:glycerate 2-kinase
MIRFDRSQTRPGFGRALVLDLFESGFAAVDPKRCVRDCVSLDGDRLAVGSTVCDLTARRVWVIGVGKAAVPMSEAILERLGPALGGGIALTRYGYGGSVEGMRVLEAGHPIPDANGLRAATMIGELADGVSADDLVVCLLSGGGSALLAAPPAGVSIGNLAETTRLLLESGAPIGEINTVRRHLSTLQGGLLTRRLHPAMTITLVLSDVVGNRLEVIASGPTVPDSSTFGDAIDVLRRHRLWERLPAPVRDHLARGADGRTGETPKPGDPEFQGMVVEIVGDNDAFLESLEQAAQRVGCHVVRVPEPVVGEASDAGRRLGRRAMNLVATAGERTLLVAGGETTVMVRGRGQGGRNQEFALAAALEIEGIGGVCVAALATDGSDGVTDAAGAIVDGSTTGLARRARVDPQAILGENDSHAALDASGDLLFTGPTRMNVADAYVALIDAD